MEEPRSVARALTEPSGQVAVNCIGVVKQGPAEPTRWRLIRANALFPHQLAAACRARGVRLIQVSTDCVFSGRSGRLHRGATMPDPVDLYGRSKLLGEPERLRGPDACGRR